MHYKVLSDNSLVDAVTLPCYVRYDRRLNLFRKCREEDAQGIAAHDGSTYWHLDGRPPFGVDGYETVALKECDVDEVASIITALDAGKQIEVIEPAPPEEVQAFDIPDGSVEVVKTYLLEQMREQCRQHIEDGFDITFDKSYRIPVTAETKSELLFAHYASQFSDEDISLCIGNFCGLLNAADVRKLMDMTIEWEKCHTARYASLCDYIRSLRSIKSLSSVSYEMDIPEKYRHGLMTALSEQALRGEKYDPR